MKHTIMILLSCATAVVLADGFYRDPQNLWVSLPAAFCIGVGVRSIWEAILKTEER